MTELRTYQRDALDALFGYWSEGGGNPLVDMATGTGKSVVIATLIRELLERWPTLRVLSLVHVRELVDQNVRALLRTWPGAPIGINSAGLGRRDTRSQILFASIQSVYKQDAYSLGQRDLVLIDEAHLVPAGGEGMYLKLLAALRERVPDMRVAGFTATPFRLDAGRLDRGDQRLFDKIVYSYGIAKGIDDGYLSPLVCKATVAQADISGVSRRGGEFVPGQLEAAVDKDALTEAAASEIVAFGEHRRAWIVFCAGVDHAHHVCDAIRSRGISCETITGKTPAGERDRIIRAYREGRIRCLTNANVLTTGFDVPHVDLIAMLRPTLSAGLYVQSVGRGTRLAAGKENCLVLDFAGNVRRFGPVDCVEIKEPGEGGGLAPVKECPNCNSFCHASARVCQDCGFEFPIIEEPKHAATADTRPIMSKAAPEWVAVSSMRAARHTKLGSPDSLRLQYTCGLIVHREWMCIEHHGFARDKAAALWRRMGGNLPVPATVDEALARIGELSTPIAIRVKPAGKYHEVIAHQMPEREERAA